MDSFYKFFLDSPFVNEHPTSFLLLFLMGMLRILPIMAVTPFLGAKTLPHPVKVALGICYFIILLPHILVTSETAFIMDITLFAYGFKEIFVGTVIGLVSAIPFYIAETAGTFVDHQRGGTSLMVNDPILQNQNSPIGIIQNYVLIVVFYALNGPFIFFEAVIQSYTVVPIDAFLGSAFFADDAPFWNEVIGLMGYVLRIAIKLAGPALITILMTDVFLGIANRLAPQVMITFLGMPLKSLFGLGIICIGWGAITTQLRHELMTWLYRIYDLIDLFVYR